MKSALLSLVLMATTAASLQAQTTLRIRGSDTLGAKLVPQLAEAFKKNGGKVSFDKHHCIYLAGLIMALAAVNRVHLRWGGDWDEDGEPITDQTFNDLVHFEIVE